MTTTAVGDVHSIFGIDSIATAIGNMVGEHAEAIDITAAMDGYRDYLTNWLPVGYQIVGDNVIRDTDAPMLIRTVEEIRQDIADDADGFDISRYAMTKTPEPPTVDDEQSKHSAECQRSGLWLLHAFADGMPCDEVADISDAEAASIARVTVKFAHRLVRRANTEAEPGSGPAYHTAGQTMWDAHKAFLVAAEMFGIAGAEAAPEMAAATKQATDAKRIRGIYAEMGNHMYELAKIRSEGDRS